MVSEPAKYRSMMAWNRCFSAMSLFIYFLLLLNYIPIFCTLIKYFLSPTCESFVFTAILCCLNIQINVVPDVVFVISFSVFLYFLHGVFAEKPSDF